MSRVFLRGGAHGRPHGIVRPLLLAAALLAHSLIAFASQPVPSDSVIAARRLSDAGEPDAGEPDAVAGERNFSASHSCGELPRPSSEITQPNPDTIVDRGACPRTVNDAAGDAASTPSGLAQPTLAGQQDSVASLGVARPEERIDYVRAGIVAAVTGGIVTAVHIYQANAWWQGERSTFRLENDWSYALDLDKCGHTFGAYFAANLFRGALMWMGFEEPKGTFYGSLLGVAYQLYVETEDGFHRNYGFSPGDALADILGGMLPMVQKQYPVLANFRLKWSYAPSQEYLDAIRAGESRAFIDDYQGQSYWIGIDPHFFLPKPAAELVPSWLGLAVGAASRNLDGFGGGDRIFYLALDYNLSKIHSDSELIRGILRVIDFFHLPSPGISLRDGKLRLGFYY